MGQAFPKPKSPPKPAVKVFRDGREVCNLETKEGKEEYDRRKRAMWERQNKRCCLEGKCPGCPGRLRWEDASFEHEAGRGGGKRDDRILVDGKWQNGVCHHWCNRWKGSRRIEYADVP